MRMRLQGKRALVTGAGPNIGQAICLALAEEGATVACNSMDSTQAHAVTEQIQRNGGRALAVTADVTEPAEVEAMMDLVAGRMGGLDILVNNAAIAVRKGLLAITLDEWQRSIDVILTGTFLCSRLAADLMVRQQRGGSIVNIASTSGHWGRANALAYCAAKGGLLNMTRAMAMDLAPHRIRVNSVSPTRTGSSVGGSQTGEQRSTDGIPLGRLGRPRDQALAVLYLVSEDAEFVTGCDLRVDGGSIAAWGDRGPSQRPES
jgi:NAD(P)-dependent dehydrogenase (short-subunit alcohol dehydrogenase family)